MQLKSKQVTVVSTAGGTVVNQQQGYKYFLIQNTDSSVSIEIFFGEVPIVLGEGLVLKSDEVHDMTVYADNKVTAIAASATVDCRIVVG